MGNSLHFFKRAGPAALCITLSMPPPPRRVEFAALTIASHLTFVISDFTIDILFNKSCWNSSALFSTFLHELFKSSVVTSGVSIGSMSICSSVSITCDISSNTLVSTLSEDGCNTSTVSSVFFLLKLNEVFFFPRPIFTIKLALRAIRQYVCYLFLIRITFGCK